MLSRQFFDALGQRLILPQPPRRIVSLVPSQTELLYTLGLDEAVAGITKFCVHPGSWFRQKPRIGGTKDIHPDRVHSLQPDLILANKEENDRSQVEALARQYPTWVSDVKTLEDALDMIRSVGILTDRQNQANQLAGEIALRFSTLPAPLYSVSGLPSSHLSHSPSSAQPSSSTQSRTPSSPACPASSPQVAYFIWRQPWMVAGGDTFISDMLIRCGLTNFFGDKSRYPTIDLPSLANSGLKHVFLSSEPYPFKEQHIREVRAVLPDANIRMVDGELFSWYGSRLLQAPAYFSQLYPLCCIV